MADRLENTLTEMRQLLADRVRARVNWQLAAAGGLLFWVGLLLDRWLEPSPAQRAVALVVIAIIALLWWFLRVAPLLRYSPSDKEFLGVIARAEPEFADSLLATFEETSSVSGAASNQEAAAPKQTLLLKSNTRQEVNRSLASFNAAKVFRIVQQTSVARFAMLAWASVLVLGCLYPADANRYLHRLALSPEPWPRAVRLVPEGFEYDTTKRSWIKHFPRGAQAELVVWAELNNEEAPAPSTVRVKSLRFFDRKIAESMLRVGTLNESSLQKRSQQYRLRLDELHQTLELRLSGGDDQIQVQLIASDRPTVASVQVLAKPPAYLQREPVEWDPAMAADLPEGTTLELIMQSTKQLASAEAVWMAHNGDTLPLVVEITSETGACGKLQLATLPLTKGGTLSVVLADSHQILNEQPYRLPIEIEEDIPPTINLRLDGIGRLITKNAVLSVLAKLRDDHRLVQYSLCLENAEQSEATKKVWQNDFAFQQVVAKTDAQKIDFETLLADPDFQNKASLSEGARLKLFGTARDAYNLADREDSRSEVISLQIVSPEELLNHLSEREREQRQALEGMLADARRLLYSLQRAEQSETRASSGEWLLETNKLSRDLQGLVNRTVQIRSEAVNNRLNRPKLVERLTDRVIDPLKQLYGQELQQLIRLLTPRDTNETDFSADKGSELVPLAEQTVHVIESVIEAMQANESYNEVVSTLRAILREQKKLNQKTEAERQAELFELLED